MTKNREKSLLLRLWQYQKERFPIVITFFTTSVLILSLAKVIEGSIPSFPKLWLYINFGVLSLLFMTHIRFFDELRDYKHDSNHYPNRPVQRGLISLTEVRYLAYSLVVLELIFVAIIKLEFFVWYIPVLFYSLLASRDYWLGNKLKKHLLLYNFLQSFQLIILLIFLYVASEVNPDKNVSLILYGALVYFSIFIIEWARKMRLPKDENISRDSYSALLGTRGSAYGLIGMFSVCVWLVYLILQSWLPERHLWFWSILYLPIIIVIAIWYARWQSKRSVIAIQLSTLIFYFIIHLVIIFS